MSPSHLPLRINLIFLAIVATLAGLLLAWGTVWAAPGLQAAPDQLAATTFPTPTHLPDQPVVNSPDISFISSPTASCVLPRANTGICFVTWPYLYANAAPNYMITMTVSIDAQPRALYSGFFQNSMYVPSEMLVFRVACGAAGSSGNPNFGMSHQYVLRARDTAGLTAANYGSVTCPADEPLRIYMPLLQKLQ